MCSALGVLSDSARRPFESVVDNFWSSLVRRTTVWGALVKPYAIIGSPMKRNLRVRNPLLITSAFWGFWARQYSGTLFRKTGYALGSHSRVLVDKSRGAQRALSMLVGTSMEQL